MWLIFILSHLLLSGGIIFNYCWLTTNLVGFFWYGILFLNWFWNWIFLFLFNTWDWFWIRFRFCFCLLSFYFSLVLCLWLDWGIKKLILNLFSKLSNLFLQLFYLFLFFTKFKRWSIQFLCSWSPFFYQLTFSHNYWT